MSRVVLNDENQITVGYSSTYQAVDVVNRLNQLDTIIAHSNGIVILTKTIQKKQSRINQE